MAGHFGLVVSGLLTPAHDQRILGEYREFLTRPKWPFGRIGCRFPGLKSKMKGPPVASKPLSFSLPDADDEPFLEAALFPKPSP